MARFNPCLTNPFAAAPVPGVTYEITGAGLKPVAPTPPPTSEELAQRQEFRRQREEQLARKETLVIEYIGQPGAEPVVVADGMMAVTLSLKFDNSDTMTDYFDRHASFGPDFAVLIVKKQAETERLARKALALAFPTPLVDVTWKWKTEKWSMGHGNYLESSGFELPASLHNLETGYRSGSVTHAHWEIEFRRAHGAGFQLPPQRHFGRPAAETPSTAPVQAGGVTLVPTKHTKTGADLWVVQLADRVDRVEYERINKLCRSHGGYYSSYRGHGAVPGFTFKVQAQAAQFLAEISGTVTASATTPDETADEQRPHRLDDVKRPCQIVPHPTKPDWFMVMQAGDAQNTVGETLRAAGPRDHCEGWLKKITDHQATRKAAAIPTPQVPPMPGMTPLGLNQLDQLPPNQTLPTGKIPSSPVPAWRRRVR